MSGSCNSRHFSWIVKSCCPAPDGSQTFSPVSAARKTTVTVATPTSIASLPDDLLIDILSRLPLSSIPFLPSVCRHWQRLVDSPSFVHLRRQRHLFCPTLFALSFSCYGLLTSSLHLTQSSNWQTSEPRSVDSGFFSFSMNSNARVAAIGRRIYILGWNLTAELDAWTSSIKLRPPMLFSRKKFAAASVSGKIYVTGGSARTSEVESYDPETSQWSIVSDAPRRRYGCLGVGIDGIFYIIGGMKTGSAFSGTEAQAYSCSMDLYDVEARVWLRSRAVPGGGCVVAACGANGNVYVLASHAVELSFWQFNGRRKVPGGVGSFGEWSRMKGPPLPAQVRLDSTVRFSCVGWEDKVVLVQVMGCIDDLLRRSGRSARGYRGGLVLIFDCVTQEWSRAADLPEVVARAACACVEC